jgi:hypothetical protein
MMVGRFVDRFVSRFMNRFVKRIELYYDMPHSNVSC